MPAPLRRRVLVVTTDPLTDTMPGPAIRAWHLAEALAGRHQTTLGSTVASSRTHPAMAVVDLQTWASKEQLEAWADVLVVPAGVLHEWPQLENSSKPLVVDLYDPYHLENLEPGAESESEAARTARVAAMTGAISAHLRRGDFFLCATERQRDFWLGSLAAVGRVNPATYDQDPTLSALIAAVPFGMPAEPPERQGPGLRDAVAGISRTDQVILWAGGVYNWFDPVSLVRAMAGLSSRMPEAKLVFLGMGHPNPAIPAMRVATEARRVADELGLTGRAVFFNEGWVPYDKRAAYLLDADVGVSTHLDHVETRYSFRTRVLDYLWAGLPMVLTGGDVLADRVESAGLGRTVPPGDVAAIEDALAATLSSPAPDQTRFDALRAELSWERVAGPLVEFCGQPTRAPDASPEPSDRPSPEPSDRPSPEPSDQPSPEPPAAGGYTPPVPTLRAKLRALRDRVVVPVALQTADRTADRLVQPVLAETAQLQRILGDQGDAADEVAETLGRAITRLSSEVAALGAEVARLGDRLDRPAPPTGPDEVGALGAEAAPLREQTPNA